MVWPRWFPSGTVAVFLALSNGYKDGNTTWLGQHPSLHFFFFPIETKRRERLENVGSFRFLEKDRLRKCSYFGEQKRRRWRDCASLRGYLSCCCYLRLQILSYSFQCIAFPPTYVSSGWGSVICNQESYSTGPNLPFQSYLQLLTFLNP